MTPVKITRRRSSGTRHAFASQENNLGFLFLGGRLLGRGLRGRAALRLSFQSLGGRRLAQQRHRAAGSFDLLAGARRARVRDDGPLRGEVAVAEDLDVLARRADQADLLEELGRPLGSRLEAVERGDVHGLRVRAERADRHRVLRGRAALLADAHVHGHLPAFEACAHLVRAGARLLALDPAARVAALAGAESASDALAILARLRRLQVREVELLGGHYLSTFTRWRTFRSIPASAGDSSCSTVRPMRPRPSARNVPRCRSDWPILERTCVMRSFAISCSSCGRACASASRERAPRRPVRAPAPARVWAPARAWARAPACTAVRATARRRASWRPPRDAEAASARRPSPAPC